MNNRSSALAALSLLVAALTTGCGHSPATAPTAIAPAPLAARATVAATLPAHLVIDDVRSVRSDRNERITIIAHCDSRSETFVFSSFFPYYVPMYGNVVENGTAIKLDPAIAVPLDKLLHAADTTALSPRAQQNLHTALYGLDFVARVPDSAASAR